MNSDDPLSYAVRNALEQYFADLEGEQPHAIYDMVLAKIEKPMLEVVLQHAQGNQTVAADILGMNRNTLRKKLRAYALH